MTETITRLTVQFPSWLTDIVSAGIKTKFTSTKQKMEFVISLADQNVGHGTGGPFGAAVFTKDTGRLVGAGVNLVLSSGLSAAHAEIVALSSAQKYIGSYNLSARGISGCELYSSSAPCAMCLGAIPWSGVCALVCAARDSDVRSIGFDEGEKVDDWIGSLGKRGIGVTVDVCRDESVAILKKYAAQGGVIY